MSNCERRFLLRAIEEKKVNWEFSAASARLGCRRLAAFRPGCLHLALVGPGNPRRSRWCSPQTPCIYLAQVGSFQGSVMPATVSAWAPSFHSPMWSS